MSGVGILDTLGTGGGLIMPGITLVVKDSKGNLVPTYHADVKVGLGLISNANGDIPNAVMPEGFTAKLRRGIVSISITEAKDANGVALPDTSKIVPHIMGETIEVTLTGGSNGILNPLAAPTGLFFWVGTGSQIVAQGPGASVTIKDTLAFQAPVSQNPVIQFITAYRVYAIRDDGITFTTDVPIANVRNSTFNGPQGPNSLATILDINQTYTPFSNGRYPTFSYQVAAVYGAQSDVTARSNKITSGFGNALNNN